MDRFVSLILGRNYWRHFSGVFAFLGVFYTIKYYKESDEQKEKAAIKPFLLVTVGADKDTKKGFALGAKPDEKKMGKNQSYNKKYR